MQWDSEAARILSRTRHGGLRLRIASVWRMRIGIVWRIRHRMRIIKQRVGIIMHKWGKMFRGRKEFRIGYIRDNMHGVEVAQW